MAKNPAANSRAGILNTARQLFLKEGYHKVSMRTIAKTAGISTGPLYFHFQNKAQVFVEVCLEGLELLHAAYREAATQTAPAYERLREIYRAHQRFFHEEHPYYELIKLGLNPISGIDIPPELKENLLAKQLELLKIKEELIRAGIAAGEIRAVDPVRFSLFLEAVSEGIFQENDLGILSRAGLGLDQMIDNAIELIGFSMVKPAD